MRTNTIRLAWVAAIAAFWLAFMGVSVAQQTTTTVDIRNFEVILVNGNKLVVRDQNGTEEYSVSDDFRFTVDGKSMSVKELKAGMKGTATITTMTTVKPVVVTEVREAEVLRASDTSVTVKEGDNFRRYTQGQLAERGVQIFKEGQPIRIADLRRGDKLTAIIVTQGPPEVLTEKDVQATLAEPTTGAATPQVASTTTAASPKSSSTALAEEAAQPAAAPADSPRMGIMGWAAIAVVVVLAVVVFSRRKEQAAK